MPCGYQCCFQSLHDGCIHLHASDSTATAVVTTGVYLGYFDSRTSLLESHSHCCSMGCARFCAVTDLQDVDVMIITDAVKFGFWFQAPTVSPLLNAVCCGAVCCVLCAVWMYCRCKHAACATHIPSQGRALLPVSWAPMPENQFEVNMTGHICRCGNLPVALDGTLVAIYMRMRACSLWPQLSLECVRFHFAEVTTLSAVR